MSALLLHAQNKVQEAKSRYAEIVATEPRAAIAANNLAWIYADEAENLVHQLLLEGFGFHDCPDLGILAVL